MTSVAIDGVRFSAGYNIDNLPEEETQTNPVENESIFTAQLSAKSSTNPTNLPEHDGFHLFDRTEWSPELGDAIGCKGALSKAGDAVGNFFKGIGNFFGNIFSGIGNFVAGLFGGNKTEETDNSNDIDDNNTEDVQKERFEGISDEIIEQWGAFADPYGDIYYDTDGELIVETRIGNDDDEMKDFYEQHLGEVRYDYINDDGRRIIGIAVNVQNENPSEKNLETRDGAIGNTKQGQKGDCWLLSGVNALNYTEEGRQIIKDALEYHDGYTTVHLKGAKDYEITDKEVEEARAERYSTGDDDMLILELAIQKAFEDIDNKNYILGSTNTNSGIANGNGTIEGSHSENLIYLITGKESDHHFEGVANFNGSWSKDLSDVFDEFMSNKGKDRAVVLSAIGETVVQDVNGNDVKIYAPHAYALKSATGDTVTFTNPHDSSIDITVSRETAINAFGSYENCDLSDKNPNCKPPTFPEKVYEDGTKVYDESFEHKDYDESKITLYSKDGGIINTFYCLSFDGTPDKITRFVSGESEKAELPEGCTLSGKEIINNILKRDLMNKDNLSLDEIVQYASLSESEWQEAKKNLA